MIRVSRCKFTGWPNRILLTFLRRNVKWSSRFLSSDSVSLDVTNLMPKDEENIVYSLNHFSKKQLEESGVLPSTLLEEICRYRNEKESFLSLGDVLSLPGMNNEVFKKICHSFKSERLRPGILRYDPDYIKYFSPSLSQEKLENINSVTSLEVCLDCVCYASSTRDHKITDWSHISLLGTNHSKQTSAQILEQALHVFSHIPKADVYLIETKTLRKSSPQYMQILLFLARLQATIQTLISAENFSKNGHHLLFHVKDLFVARTFDLRIGGERVSGQHLLQQMEDGELPGLVTVTPDFWRNFHRLQLGVQKERYTNCLLMAAAFINCINPGNCSVE